MDAAAATVLVVDDEPGVRNLLQRWIEAWGYSVRVAADAKEAMEAMLVQPAAIMLVDIKMPGHDGFWLLERVQAKWPQTAFIMATASAAMDTVARSKRAGAVDYLLKPFGSEMLRQALNRAEATLSHRKDDHE